MGAQALGPRPRRAGPRRLTEAPETEIQGQAGPARFRYDRPALRADLARAGLGLGLTLGPLAGLAAGPGVGVLAGALLGAAALVFLAFAARTLRLRLTEVEMDGDGIRERGPLGGAFDGGVAWADLERVRLDHYATRRDRRGGWMSLRLSGGGRLTVESGLDGFERVAARVAEAARARGLRMSERTLGNFLALGIDADPETRPPGAP